MERAEAMMSNHLQTSTDKDSLVALDALLRIRDSCQPSKKVTAVTDDNMSATASGYTPTSVNALSSLLGLTGPGSHRLILPQVSGAFPHLAAVQCAAWGAASPFGLSQSTSVQHKDIVPKPAHPPQDVAFSPNSNPKKPMDQVNETSDEAEVRKEKVEEALRSKPQRGKKRDDLSEKERLELTRTRNREHAKSTRIRKKARYQELLDREELFLTLSKNDEIKSQRCQTFQNFLSIRQGMVSHCQENQSVIESGEELTAERVEYDSLLSEVVEDISSFTFEASPGVAPNMDCIEGMLRMKAWDRVISSRVLKCFGPHAVRSLMYKVSGGTNGIALSKDDQAFARVDLLSPQSSDSSNIKILSGILTVRFAPESSRLVHVSWTTLEDHCLDDLYRYPTSESLRNQVIHPSVVSLDHHGRTTEGIAAEL